MKTDRRRFLKNTSFISAGTIISSGIISSCKTSLKDDPDQKITPYKYDEGDFNPLKNIWTLIPTSLIIDDIRLLKIKNEWIVKVTSVDGISGFAVTNNRIPNLLTMFKKLVIPYFIGKDARDIVNLSEQFYYDERIYKYSGMPIWNCFAHIEVSILDLLGKASDKPVFELIGTLKREEIPVYLSSLRRDTTPEQEWEWLGPRIYETNSDAIKLKVGGRMSKNADAYPGRTDALIPYFREKLGTDFHIFVDANGSYDAEKGIEIGKWLEEYKIGFFEEPCEWEDFVATKMVADALDMVVAGGEQDTSLPKFEWMLKNRAVDMVQPDVMYNGGIIRTLKVAKIAADFGIQITPHCPSNNPSLNHMLQLAAVLPNLGPHQEFRAEKPNFAVDYEPKIVAINGKIKLPTGPGLGITYDQAIWKIAEVIVKS